jgi:hypothetical protein
MRKNAHPDEPDTLPIAKPERPEQLRLQTHVGKKTGMVAVALWVRARGALGATVDEVEHEMPMPHQTAGPRVSDLHRAGTLVLSGKTRKTRRGKQARVFVHVDFS